MARNSTKSKSKGLGRLRQAAQAVKRVFTRKREESDTAPRVAAERSTASTPKPAPRTEPTSVARPLQPVNSTRSDTDVPLDVLNRSYTPQMTSSKGSFRSDGSDKEKDQELTPRTASDTWNDEDHYTNKSGDPRIGTHGRVSPREEDREESRH